MMGVCYIFGASECNELFSRPSDGDLVIAADGGYATATRFGITPDLLLGDFDSLGALPEGIKTRTYPVEKDDTDMGLAIAEGLARGYTEFYIYGGLGGNRPDHSFANYQLLSSLASRGARAVLFGTHQSVSALTCGVLTLYGGTGDGFSVFAVGGDATVSISGAKYPLSQKRLSADFPLGVSNAVEGECARITVHSGTALVFFDKSLKFS